MELNLESRFGGGGGPVSHWQGRGQGCSQGPRGADFTQWDKVEGPTRGAKYRGYITASGPPRHDFSTRSRTVPELQNYPGCH